MVANWGNSSDHSYFLRRPKKMNAKLTGLLVVFLLIAGATTALASDDPTYTETWDGRGADSWNCAIEGEDDPRHDFEQTGWIHWVFSTKGRSTSADLTLGGSGSGVYYPGDPLRATVWHFYTPYYDLDGLTAVINLYGGKEGRGGGLVISDWCPGEYESLAVSKTADTAYTREHFWSIAKTVATENDHMIGDYPKIWLYIDGRGNEAATWTVDVAYEGYVDSDFNVSGAITVYNDGQLPAVITAVDDLLAGAPIAVDCGVTFPYELPVGATLTCLYSADGYVEGFNEVTVTTERDAYFADVAIVWGEPTIEINKTVNVLDMSGLFGLVDLGAVTAPNNAQFAYGKDFAWADYGADGCGSFQYDNTATIVETGQSADAALKVNVQCYVYETAYAQGDPAVPFCDYITRWGWTNPTTPGTYEWPLWAGAAQCDTEKGTLVGSVTVVYDGDDYGVSVAYNVAHPYTLEEQHVYAGYDLEPPDGFTAVGLYQNYGPFDGSQVYVIAHAVVGVPDPDFGP
jgi:hypothetical protein